MKTDSQTRNSSSSKTVQSLSGRAENNMGSFEDVLKGPKYLCPFCPENFDIISLSCHIDHEHAIEAKHGVCRVCKQRVGLDLMDHVIKTHKDSSECKKISEKGKSSASLRKEQRNDCEGSSSNLQLDPILSSFNHIPTVVHEPRVVKPLSSDDKSSNEEQSKDNTTDSDRRSKMFASSSNKDEEEEEEKVGKSECVQGLILSTLLNDTESEERTMPNCFTEPEV